MILVPVFKFEGGTRRVQRVPKTDIARITNTGAITATKAVKGSEPFGITVDADADPWYTMMSANKIAEFQLR